MRFLLLQGFTDGTSFNECLLKKGYFKITSALFIGPKIGTRFHKMEFTLVWKQLVQGNSTVYLIFGMSKCRHIRTLGAYQIRN